MRGMSRDKIGDSLDEAIRRVRDACTLADTVIQEVNSTRHIGRVLNILSWGFAHSTGSLAEAMARLEFDQTIERVMDSSFPVLDELHCEDMPNGRSGCGSA